MYPFIGHECRLTLFFTDMQAHRAVIAFCRG